MASTCVAGDDAGGAGRHHCFSLLHHVLQRVWPVARCAALHQPADSGCQHRHCWPLSVQLRHEVPTRITAALICSCMIPDLRACAFTRDQHTSACAAGNNAMCYMQWRSELPRVGPSHDCLPDPLLAILAGPWPPEAHPSHWRVSCCDFTRSTIGSHALHAHLKYAENAQQRCPSILHWAFRFARPMHLTGSLCLVLF